MLQANAAARLQQFAQPGSIVIGETTYRLAGGFFHMRQLGELRLKGKAAAGSSIRYDTRRR